jgi:hypothetical protein
VPALSIFEKSIEMGKFDKSRTLSDGSMLTFKKVYPLDAVFDTPEGPHDWLTRTVILGTGRRYGNPDHTIFTYYEVL